MTREADRQVGTYNLNTVSSKDQRTRAESTDLFMAICSPEGNRADPSKVQYSNLRAYRTSTGMGIAFPTAERTMGYIDAEPQSPPGIGDLRRDLTCMRRCVGRPR